MENRAEIHQLYRIFCRIWAAGGKATFSTQSHEGLCTARLELQTGQPTAGAAGATQNVKSAQQRAHRAHRGPASKARSRARAKAFQAGKAASTAQTAKESISQEELPLPGGSTTMSSPPTPSTAPSRTPSPKRAAPPPPPPPCPPSMPLPGPVTSTRLVKFIPRERSIKSHFFRLDGQNDESVEGASGELQPNQSRGESESAPVTGKSHQDDDKDIETHEKEGHWTLVDRGKKSPKSPEAIQPEKTDQGAENPKGPPACRLLRRLPKDRREFAVPEFEDERHSVTRPDGSVVTVFAPEWVPIEKIRKAISHPID